LHYSSKRTDRIHSVQAVNGLYVVEWIHGRVRANSSRANSWHAGGLARLHPPTSAESIVIHARVVERLNEDLLFQHFADPGGYLANELLCIKRRECDKIHKMINPQSPVRLKRTQILRIAAQNGVERLRVFGSVARGTDDEQSDIDFLVELAPDRSLLDLGNFLYEVRSLLGKEVDVVTEKGLGRRIRERVLAEAVDL
jgi:predicted nucleotidyltransferase